MKVLTFVLYIYAFHGPGNPPRLPPLPNLLCRLSMTFITLGLFLYFEMLAGFLLTSWKAACTSGSYKNENQTKYEFVNL